MEVTVDRCLVQHSVDASKMKLNYYFVINLPGIW